MITKGPAPQGLEEFLPFANRKCKNCYGSGKVGVLQSKVPVRRQHPNRMGPRNKLTNKTPFVRGGGVKVQKQLCGCTIGGYAEFMKAQKTKEDAEKGGTLTSDGGGDAPAAHD